MEQIKQLLDELAEQQAALDLLALKRRDAEATVLATVKPELDAIAAEFGPMEAEATRRLEQMAEHVKAAVLSYGQTVRGTRLTAVFMSGRVSWDTKALEGYALHVPELLKFKKVGEASVTLRNAGRPAPQEAA